MAASKRLPASLGSTSGEVVRLIAGERFVTARQAVRIEAELGISARELLVEAATAKLDEQMARLGAKKRAEK